MPSFTFQEMLDIMKSIYDMMGKYTYPTMQDDAPREHVENFFQVRVNSLDTDILELNFLHFSKKKKNKTYFLLRDGTLMSIWKCTFVTFFNLFPLRKWTGIKTGWSPLRSLLSHVKR